jgi:hypothetical protein
MYFCHHYFLIRVVETEKPECLPSCRNHGGTILFSVLIISEAWYARYVPQLWFFPLVLLMASEVVSGKWISKIRSGLYILMLLNISFCWHRFPMFFIKLSRLNTSLNN